MSHDLQFLIGASGKSEHAQYAGASCRASIGNNELVSTKDTICERPHKQLHFSSHLKDTFTPNPAQKFHLIKLGSCVLVACVLLGDKYCCRRLSVQMHEQVAVQVKAVDIDCISQQKFKFLMLRKYIN